MATRPLSFRYPTLGEARLSDLTLGPVAPTFPVEVFVSVDVETAGPNPSRYSLLAIGACLVSDPRRGFYTELKPVTQIADPQAMAVHSLSLDELMLRAQPPAEALSDFEKWLAREIEPGQQPILVAFNAPFDWMFLNDYFLRFLGRNPFGHSAIDIKSFYMGLTGVPWSQTSMRYLAPRYLHERALSHHALSDARDQAELFAKLLQQARSIPHPWH
jgi:DNA polymerase III epsilon subunit-like protein